MRELRILLAVGACLIVTAGRADDSQKGFDAYNSSDYETALAVWQPLAEAGDIESQYGLGLMFGNGFGVDMDDALAVKWYGMAAEQGHAAAQCNLAVMHQNGWGLPQSDQEANKLYALAAEQGVTEAMLALGRFYAMDFAEDYDPVQAYKWFSIASLLDSIDGSVKRDFILGKLTVEQVADGDSLVEDWSTAHTDLIDDY